MSYLALTFVSSHNLPPQQGIRQHHDTPQSRSWSVISGTIDNKNIIRVLTSNQYCTTVNLRVQFSISALVPRASDDKRNNNIPFFFLCLANKTSVFQCLNHIYNESELTRIRAWLTYWNFPGLHSSSVTFILKSMSSFRSKDMESLEDMGEWGLIDAVRLEGRTQKWQVGGTNKWSQQIWPAWTVCIETTLTVQFILWMYLMWWKYKNAAYYIRSRMSTWKNKTDKEKHKVGGDNRRWS